MARKEEGIKVLDLFGLKVGDKIKIYDIIYEIVEKKESYILHPIDEDVSNLYDIENIGHALSSCNWEKIEIPLKDMRCKDFDGCKGCPFKNRVINCGFTVGNDDITIGEMYNEVKKDFARLTAEICGEEEE